MAETPVVIVLDLDFTLAHFESRYDGIYDVAGRYGVSREIAELTLRKHVDSSEWFDFGRYARSLLSDSERSLELTQSFEAHFDSDFRTYPDVESCMSRWKHVGIPVFIVTAGAPSFQQKKVEHLALPIDGYIITDITVGKGDAIADIGSRFPTSQVIFVDDKSTELLRVWNHSGVDHDRISLFKIDRPDIQEKSGEWDYHRKEFTIIESLDDLRW